MVALPNSRKEAKTTGARHYFTGKPCPRGHVAKRFTRDAGCVECKNQWERDKYHADVEASRAKSRAERQANLDRFRERGRAWYRANPDKRKQHYERDKKHRRRRRLKNKYGMSLPEWNAMFAAQGHKCAVCQSNSPRATNWHTDHCHETGTVRGIVCRPCNLLIGLAGDNPVTLAAASEYLMGLR